MNVKELKFLLTHSSIYGLGTIIAQAVAFFMLPLYTRYLTPQDYGVLELIDTTNMLIGIVMTLGIARGMSRFYYEKEEIKYKNCVVSTTYIIVGGLSLLLLPLLLFSSGALSEIIFSSETYAQYFMISFISLFFGTGLDIGLIYLRLEKKSLYFITLSITRLIVLVSLNIFFIVFLQMGVLGILLSTLITRIAYTSVVTGAILWRTRLSFSRQIAENLIKFSLPLIPSNFANTCIKQSDKYFVLYFFTIADAGIYSLTLKLGNVMHLLLTIPFIMSYVPRRFEIMKQDGANQVYKQVYTYYSFLFIFLGLTLSVFVPEILKIMITEKFYEAGRYIPLVVLSMFLLGSQYHFDFGILYSKKTKYLAYINIIIAVLHLLLNYILISKYGIWGAIWASTIILGGQALMYLYVSNRFFKIDYELLRVMKFLVVALFYYFFLKCINFQVIYINILLKILLLSTFPFISILLRIISGEEVEMIKKIYNKKIIPLLTPNKI